MEVAFADGVRVAVDEQGHAAAWASGTFGVVVRATVDGRDAALALPQLAGHSDRDRPLVAELAASEQRATATIGSHDGLARVIARSSSRSNARAVGFATGAPPRFQRGTFTPGEHWLSEPPWIAYEWGVGSLEQLIVDEAPLELAAAHDVCRVLSSALAHLHARGHVHGDVRAEHVRFTDEGGARRYFFVEYVGAAARRPELRRPGSIWAVPRLQKTVPWPGAVVRRTHAGFVLRHDATLCVKPGDLVCFGSRIAEIASASASELECTQWWSELAGDRVARTLPYALVPDRIEPCDAWIVPAPTKASDLYGLGVIALRLLFGDSTEEVA